jgi:hypothetical protein
VTSAVQRRMNPLTQALNEPSRERLTYDSSAVSVEIPSPRKQQADGRAPKQPPCFLEEQKQLRQHVENYLQQQGLRQWHEAVFR